MATQRRTLFQKLGSPMVMLALGAFEIVLGLSYLAQPRLRGQAAFLLSIGVLLVGAGALIKRGEMRRARTPTEKKTTRRANRRAAPVAARARGPKAGAGKRLAGPTRQKPEEKPKTLTERVFGVREKGGLGGEHEGGAPPRATTDPPRRRIVRPPIQKSAEERPPKA